MKLLMVVLALGSMARADVTDTVRTRLCDYWRYDFNSHSYTCEYLTMTVNLVEANRYENEIQKLEMKIAALERKIEALEKTNH